MSTYQLISQPQSEPLTLTEVKDHLNIIDAETYWDTLITALITAAREKVEKQTWRALISQQWKLILDASEVNQFTNAPSVKDQLNALEISFTAGYSRTYANPVVCDSVDITTNFFTKANHGLRNSNIVNFTVLGTVTGIALATDYYIVNRTANTFQISATLNGSPVDITGTNVTPPTYQFQQILSVPQSINSAMKLIIGDLYSYRENVTMVQFYEIPDAIKNILDPYKLDWNYPMEKDFVLITKCPLISVDSVKYIDKDGNQQTLSTTLYQVDTASEPARIKFISN